MHREGCVLKDTRTYYQLEKTDMEMWAALSLPKVLYDMIIPQC